MKHCIEKVPNGPRTVSFRQCGRNAGFGPKGEYCKQHAALHDDSPCKHVLWRVPSRGYMTDPRNPLPVEVRVRSITERQFIDEHGRRRAFETEWETFFRTESAALDFIEQRLRSSIEAAEQTIEESHRALLQIEKRRHKAKV